MIELLDDNRDGIAETGAQDTLPEYIQGTPPSIETLRRRFDEARDDPNGEDEKSRRDRDYYDGPKQLSSEVRATLRARNQPAIYTNRVRPAVNGVLGVLEQGRRDPRAYPRNPDDDGAADVATKTLRFVNDKARFNDVQMDCAETFLIEGCTAVIVEADGDTITPTQIRWEEFYWDPYSRRADFKDARYMGIAKWYDAETVRQRWQLSLADIGDPLRPLGVGILGDKFEDVGNDGGGWVNTSRRRVLVVEEYAIEGGEWKRIVYCGAGVLEYGPSPYQDERGPRCPIEAVSCYVDRENGRYGMVRDMIPVQDEINASRSRSLHLMNSRQVQQTDPSAPPVDSETARTEAAKADGVIPAGWAIVSTAEQGQANMIRMQEAKGEIERMGPTPAVLGRSEGGDQSGRARLVSQQAGLTELARPLGRLHGWVLRVYEQMWRCAQQFWDQPMWVRVTDDVKAPDFLKVNEPVMGPIQQQAPNGSIMTGIGVVDTKNRLAALDVDIILDQDNDTATLQQEVWAEIMELLRLGMSPFSPEFEMAIEMSPLADKQRVLERLKAKKTEIEQQQAQQGQMQQVAQQLEMAEKKADLDDKQASTLGKIASAHKTAAEADKTQAELYAGLGLNPMMALAPEEPVAPSQPPIAPMPQMGYSGDASQGMPPPG